MPIFSADTTIVSNWNDSQAVCKAIDALQRDFTGILEKPLNRINILSKNQIRIEKQEGLLNEQFSIDSSDYTNTVIINASDELGAIFGIYYFSENILGVDPFWFWTDFKHEIRQKIEIKSFHFISNQSNLCFRGWFINDEDCLIGWNTNIKITENLWGVIFETILRAGYNMVIPGTGLSPNDFQLDLATSYGLWIAQHHVEPLGAPMFKDVYPEVELKLPEEKKRYYKLYRDAVFKSKDRKMVWTVGFRGQGDRPFYEDDKRYDTDLKRASLIEEMIDFQMGIVNEIMEEPQYFIHYLYNESAKLYRSGDLKLSNNIIRIYCDNGYGAMRVRRNLCEPEQGISSMPQNEEWDNEHGVYYHISFHDLEASNKLVPLIHPQVIINNLSPFVGKSTFSFFICNVSNIRPHILHIQLLRSLWDQRDSLDFNVRVNKAIDRWLSFHFNGVENETKSLLFDYFDAPFKFNPIYPDSKSGEQLFHHGLRRMIRGVIREENVKKWFSYLPLISDSDKDYFQFLLDKAEGSLEKWVRLCYRSYKLNKRLNFTNNIFFNDNLGMHIRYMRNCCEGFIWGVRAVLSYKKHDYKEAFIKFQQSNKYMRKALDSLYITEHDKWKGFYNGDWLTGTRETIRYIETMLSLSRIKGEDLLVNSSWMEEAMHLSQTAISLLPQSNTPNSLIAESLYQRMQNSSEKQDISILDNSSI